MDKKKSITPSLPRLEAMPHMPTERAELQKRSNIPRLWLWTALVLVVGIIIVSAVSLNAANWIKNVQIPGIGVQNTTLSPVTTLKVQRNAPYAGLDMTIVNAQYATSFSDDEIRSRHAVVRLNMQIANHTTGQINIVYYDIARLLAPNINPLAPTNVHLSVGPKPGTSETGWIDFSVPRDVQLSELALQLGSTTLNETVVTIPFTGPLDSARYADRVSSRAATISYTFFTHVLTYHLTSIEMRYAYQGSQCKAGQQFYILNFSVDNPEGADVSPGYGFDYMRLLLNGSSRPPIDNSLPYTFKAGAKGVSGHVVFSAPSGLKSLTIGFLSQNGNGEQDTSVTL